MVTVYLQGGLGNQMFQIATTLNYAMMYGDEAIFNLDNSHTPHQGKNISKYKGKLFQFNHNSDVYDKTECTFSQPSHGYCVIPHQPNQQLHGFFQSEKFFVENRDIIVGRFRDNLRFSYLDRWDIIKRGLSELQTIENKPIVSVHIRRGDYLKFTDIHAPCSLSYYNEAMGVMEEKIGPFHTYFVSDDIEWCRETFDGRGTFSKYTDEIDDLILMSNCDHHIIANSSFSWWGAYLNNNIEKIVIGPKTWFGPSGPKDQDDTIPNEWIKI